MKLNGNAACCDRLGENTTLRAAVCLLLAGLAAAPGQGRAEETAAKAFNLSLPASSLAAALNRLAETSGLHLVYDASLAQGLSTAGLSGSYTAEQALQKLLQGTGLSYRVGANRTVTLEKPSTVAPPSGASLEKVTVTAHSAEREAPYQAAVSTAGSKIPVGITRVPQSVQVVTEEAIKDQGALTMGSIMKGVPSANVGQSRYSRFPKFTIRGFKAIQQRNGFRTQFNSDVDYSALTNVESFEVLKGPGSALYGNGSIGGLVNIVTKRPKKEFGGYVAGIGGEYDQKGVQFDVTGAVIADGALTARITGDLERSGSFIKYQGLDRDNLALALSWDNGGPVRGFLNMEYQDRDTKPNPGVPAPGQIVGKTARDTYLGEPGMDNLRATSPVLQTWLDIDVADNWTLSPRFQYMEFNVGGTQIFMNSVRADRRTINRSGRADFRENDFMYTGQLDLKGKFDTGFISHQVLIGGEYEDATSNGGWTALNGVPAMDALNPTYLSTQLTPGKAFVFRNDKRIGSFYFQDMMAITDKFDLFGGVRQSNVAGSKLAANGAATQYDLDNKSFQVGGAYHVLEPVTLFAGYGTGFDVDASFAAQAARATAFKPEKSDQVEAGVKLALPFGLTSTASFFDITRSNVVTPDPANPGFNAQVGEMRSRGAEIDLAYQINKQWFVQAGYALIDAKITKSQNGDVGNRPWDVAPHQANVWTRYKFDEGLLKDLSLGAGANFVAKRPGDNAHTFDLPAYTTVDMSASYQWKKVKAELFALNMLDKHYYTSNDQMTGAFTGAPRQIYGRLTLEF